MTTATIVELTKKLISFRTVKGREEELEKCTQFITDYFKDSEVKVRRIEHNGIRSLYLSYDDENEQDLLFSGHYDVVEANDEQFTAKIEEDKLIGRGALDMKTGIAIIMQLMKDNEKNKPSIAALLTSDEETGGDDGTGNAVNQGIKGKLVIAVEQNDADNPKQQGIVNAGKGIFQLKIKARGVAAHGAYLWKGENAIETLMNAYQEIQTLFPKVTKEDHWRTSLNIGKISGGEAANKVPDYAEATLDFRYTEAESPEDILQKLAQIKNIEVEVLAKGAMLYNNPEDEHIEALADIAEEITREEVPYIKIMGASDIRYTSAKNMPSVLMGPWGEGMHGISEYCLISSITPCYETLQKYITTQTQQQSQE